MFLGKKEKEIEELMKKFFAKVKATLPELLQLVSDYVKMNKQFKEEAYQVHCLEHEADSLRREIMSKLSQGAFLPFFREDYIVLVIIGDEIANLAEAVASYLVLTRPKIPDFLKEGIKDLTASTVATFGPIEEMIACNFDDCDQLPQLAKLVEDSEQKCDRFQWELTKALFKSNLQLAEKLHLKALIDMIANISDHIEDVAERFVIIQSKRPV